MTPEQKQKYFKAEGSICPYCGSLAISALDHIDETGALSAERTIECGDCGKHWRDIYTLTDVEEVIEQ